ncbi:MAG: hypothetical protein KGH64_03685 [Candidatus Micrarchaeota archaeon]|nr:hypothetical protein [Candidatus Micrarchaeota archaeon]MDE1834411.1 hypothetical protein [Candidatus Micrarchaeota archaeon]MDE1858904.1 hypothetical protein [Candidatus Micrarchaeota archaeon]
MKRLTLTGILLVIFSLGILYASYGSFSSTVANNTVQALALSPHEAIDVPFQVQNSTILSTIYFVKNGSIAYYLVNSSAYSKLSHYTDANSLLNASESLKGNGVYEILSNSSSGSYPLQPSIVLRSQDYYYNGTDNFAAGTYYDIFQNLESNSTTVYYTVVTKLQLSESNSIFYSAAYGLTGTVLLIIGVIIIGYSFLVQKSPASEDAAKKDEIDKLYAEINEKEGSTRTKKARKNKKRN